MPRKLPAGVGQLLPKGADLIMQVHYHRTGKEERDRTKIGLYFQKGEVKGHFQALPVPGLFLQVPKGEKAYKVNTSVTLGGKMSETGTIEVLLGIVGVCSSIATMQHDPFPAGIVFMAAVLLLGLGAAQIRKYKGWD